ncbi:unnamed protein product [Somion occarium]|uniref:Uncharacterized protein n=1 Tax=Somion occarium TaxID=3059160 RepID=A0ABP1DVR1_9APHY
MTTAAAFCPTWPGQFMSQWIGSTDDRMNYESQLASCDSAKQRDGSWNCRACIDLLDNGKKFCAFDTTTMTCVPRPSKMTDDYVGDGNPERCATLQQISNLKPKKDDITAARTEWDKIKTHVLEGETSDKTSGRHLFTTWQAVHKGEKGICDTKTNLCSFMRETKVHKTVWDDRSTTKGGYSRLQVKDICIAAIILHKSFTDNPLSVSIQTSQTDTGAGKSICVTHRTSASCFPDGIKFTPIVPGKTCTGTGDAEDANTVPVTL